MEQHNIINFISLLTSALGINGTNKEKLQETIKKLNQPEFEDIYASLSRVSSAVNGVLSGNQAPDLTKSVLEKETTIMKAAFDGLIKSGKISKEEADKLKTEASSNKNIETLKTLVNSLKA